MINITRDESTVQVEVSNGPLGSIYHFTYNCGNKWYASLLRDRLSKELSDLTQAIRKEEYERGFKDGRHHKVKKEWFSSRLAKGNA